MKVEKINYSDGLAIKYCIRNGQGKYSSGGSYPSWKNFERAKVWNSIGPLKGHLNMFEEIPPDWEIVSVIHQIREPGLNARNLYQGHLLRKKEIENMRGKKHERIKIQEEIDRLFARLDEIR